MPDADGPKFTANPPGSKREPAAKAAGRVDPPDAPEVIASTEPDDDLADYIVPPDPPADEPDVVKATPAPSSDHAPRSTGDAEEIRRLREELAAANTRLAQADADVRTWGVSAPPTSFEAGDKVLIHVRQDGFTANGRVWYRGQELEFTVGEQNYRDTVDRFGNSWLALTEADQLRRYGEVQFGHGAWPGETYESDRASAAERARGRTAPTIAQITNVTEKTSNRT